MATERKALHGRFLRRRVCDSPTVAAFIREHGPWAGLLFDRLILQSDDDGRFLAEPMVIAAKCFPHHRRPRAQVARHIQGLAHYDFIVLYSDDAGSEYGAWKKWRKHQPKPRSNRYIPSEFPPPPASQLVLQAGVQTASQSGATEAEEEVEVEVVVAKPRQKRPGAPAPDGWKECLEAYSQGYEQTTGERPVMDQNKNGVDFVRLKAMLKHFGKEWEKLQAIIGFAVSGDDPEWPTEQGLPSLQTICSKHHVNRIMAIIATKGQAKQREVARRKQDADKLREMEGGG